jgi:hypothetical protein
MLIEFYKVHERDSIPLGLPVYKTGALGTSLRYLRETTNTTETQDLKKGRR